VPPDGADAEFAEFYRHSFGRVAASVRVVAGAAAEDVAQEALIAAHLRWDEISQLDIPFAWVRKVARRIAGRYAERDRVRSTLEARMTLANRGPMTIPDLDLVGALASLPDRHAAAVWLHHVADRPVVEVAERLGCSVAATKVLLLRSRRRMGDQLSSVRGRWVSERSWHVIPLRDGR
jgi:RNA polymerase sigma factor (sigma-70 family)